MRVLRPIVCSQSPIMFSREPDCAECCRIRSQPVGHNPARRKAVPLKQLHHEFLSGLCIPSALDEEIEYLALVVDRPPESVLIAADRNHHFIEVPMIARSRPRTADISRDRWSELQEPPPDRLVGCVNASLGQQFFDIPKGQGEPGIEPDRVTDDFWWEAVALKRYRSHPMMLIGDEPQSYPSYRDIALVLPTPLAWSRGPGTSGARHVRFGSSADLDARIRDVGFTPSNGRAQRRHRCPLSANRGHTVGWATVKRASCCRCLTALAPNRRRAKSTSWISQHTLWN